MNLVIFFRKKLYLFVLNLYVFLLRIKVTFFLVIICRVGEWIEMFIFMFIRELLLVFYFYMVFYSLYI